MGAALPPRAGDASTATGPGLPADAAADARRAIDKKFNVFFNSFSMFSMQCFPCNVFHGLCCFFHCV